MPTRARESLIGLNRQVLSTSSLLLPTFDAEVLARGTIGDYQFKVRMLVEKL